MVSILKNNFSIYQKNFGLKFTFNWYHFFLLVSIGKKDCFSFNWFLSIYIKICFYWYQNLFWDVLPIYKGSLTFPLHIDSWWVWYIKKWLTSFLYIVHMCRESLTYLLMHCILCLYELGFSHLFLHIMHVCRGELTLCLSSSWMYIAYTFILFIFLYPFVDEWQKRGEEFEFIYMFY